MPQTTCLRIAMLPDADQLSGNPYWQILLEALRQAGAEVVGTDSFGRRWLWRNRGRINVLHFHYVQQFYAYEATQARLRWVIRFAVNLLIARALGYRTVFTLHNLKPTYRLHPVWVDDLAHWFVANFTDRVIVHCEAARAALAAQFGRHRNVFTVPHPHYIGVYPNTLTPVEARARLGLTAEQIVFVFFGGIRPNKGVETLIAAFRQLPEPNLALLIAGKPWPPPEYFLSLMKLAESDSRIRFFPYQIADEEVQIYLNAADAVVLPFASILTSGSVMLALSFGKAVIVPARGCLPELITSDVGFLYDPYEAHSLACALRRAREADLARIGQSALTKISAIGWQEMAKQTLAAYR